MDERPITVLQLTWKSLDLNGSESWPAAKRKQSNQGLSLKFDILPLRIRIDELLWGHWLRNQTFFPSRLPSQLL